MEYRKLIFLINKEEERAGRRTEPIQGVTPSALHLLTAKIFLVPSASSLCSFVRFSYVVVLVILYCSFPSVYATQMEKTSLPVGQEIDKRQQVFS